MAPSTKVKDVYEFAAELADHAPDLTDDQVCVAVAEYEGAGGEIQSPLPRRHGALRLLRRRRQGRQEDGASRLFGLDMTAG